MPFVPSPLDETPAYYQTLPTEVSRSMVNSHHPLVQTTPLRRTTQIETSLGYFEIIDLPREARCHLPGSHPPNNARWYLPGEKVVVKGFEISAGFLYVGERLKGRGYSEDDYCLVNPNLRIQTRDEVPPPTHHFFFVSSYAGLSGSDKASFLEWNADHRRDPDVTERSLSVFLFGLERRLLVDRRYGEVDATEHQAIKDEICRLINLYSKKGDFFRLAVHLLVMDWLMRGGDLSVCDAFENLKAKFVSKTVFEVQLSFLVMAQRPLSSEIFWQWLQIHGSRYLKTPARRCHTFFSQLFSKRYHDQFGEGLKLRPNKTNLEIFHLPWSESIGPLHLEHQPPLPDPSVLTSPLKKVLPLVDTCHNDLADYSRYIGREHSSPDSLAALCWLPNELLTTHPKRDVVETLLEEWCNTADKTNLLVLEEVFSQLGEIPPDQGMKQQLLNLARLLNLFGYGMAPDLRYQAGSPKLKDKIILYAGNYPPGFTPSRHYLLMVPLLRMLAFLIKTDSKSAATPTERASHVISQHAHLTEPEKRGLNAFFSWCRRTPQKKFGLRKSLDLAMPHERQAMGHVLAQTIYFAGPLPPKQSELLRKYYNLLGLDPDQVAVDLHASLTADQPTLVAHRDPLTSFRIPPPPGPHPTQIPVNLDPQRVQVHREETRQVKQVLETIFGENTTAPAGTPTQRPSPPARPSRENILDTPHRSLLQQLVSREEWPNDAFEANVKTLGLMRNAAVEKINEWSLNVSEAPLLEDEGDTIYIDLALAEELNHGAN